MNGVFQKYGRSVFLSDEGWNSPVFRAFLQPLRYKNKMYLEGAYTEIGRDTSGLYLYIGPHDHDVTKLSRKARIADADGKAYLIQRAEKILTGDKPYYFWAVVKEVCEVK